MMTERPITQHGLSGLPSTARVGTATAMRQVKDKRYWMVNDNYFLILKNTFNNRNVIEFLEYDSVKNAGIGTRN